MGKWVLCTQPNYFLPNLTHLTPLLGMEVKMLSQSWASHNYPTMKHRKLQAQWNQSLNASLMQKPPTKTQAYKITSSWKGKPNGRRLLEEKAKPKPITRIKWLLVYNPPEYEWFWNWGKNHISFWWTIKICIVQRCHWTIKASWTTKSGVVRRSKHHKHAFNASAVTNGHMRIHDHWQDNQSPH